MRPRGIDPDSKVGQVLTQGQRPALMTIDNNLSLLDFQPNSLLERGNHCLKTAGHKWSGRNKGLIKTASTQRLNMAVSLQCIYIMIRVEIPPHVELNSPLIIHVSEIAWLEVTMTHRCDRANFMDDLIVVSKETCDWSQVSFWPLLL